jgi:hypothetical protein
MTNKLKSCKRPQWQQAEQMMGNQKKAGLQYQDAVNISM